jgi:1-aminocyclopropane-1-carboxylate synthase
VWVDLGAFVCEDTREAENELWLELYQATGILLTPGSGFGHRGYGQFRMVYPYVRKPALEVAMQRLAEFVTNKRKES